VEELIANELKEFAFFSERSHFISVVSGDACDLKFWEGTEKSDLLYTTAISGPMFLRILTMHAIAKDIPHIISFENNINGLVSDASTYGYGTLLRNCKFRGSSNSRTLVACYLADICTVELSELVALDKIKSFLNMLSTTYELLSSRRESIGDVEKYIHPTCGHYTCEPLVSTLQFLEKLKITEQVDAAIVCFEIGELIYSRMYVESILDTVFDTNIILQKDFKNAKYIINIAHFLSTDHIKQLGVLDQNGPSFFGS
jgi:hypothetical protein